MVEKIREKGRVDDPIIAQEVKIGVCEGEPADGFVIAFKGKKFSTKEEGEVSAIIPRNGIPDLIQALFATGVQYQKETGVDIGFTDVLKEKNDE
ncbi:MAG TPA: hypothetical protein H9732_09625 [Candidatus Mediterraneibacter avicola]|nr:hypothetical protein [Candidatus Mediterraneibacter avicola]